MSGLYSYENSVNNENSPSSLRYSCVRQVIIHGINVKDVALPQELCNLIIDVSLCVLYDETLVSVLLKWTDECFYRFYCIYLGLQRRKREQKC